MMHVCVGVSACVCVGVCGAWKSEMQDGSPGMGRGSIRMPATIATNSRCFIECVECASMGQLVGGAAMTGMWVASMEMEVDFVCVCGTSDKMSGHYA